MIIKASQRGGGRKLAADLMNDRDNEHIELHEVRGFVSGDLHGAFLEFEAAAKGTKCKQHFFSVSLSPPETENVRPEVFELAARRIEDEMGLERQPMALVFHEKDGRRHAHAVWSRIDTDNMRAINLPHFKRKLNEISRGLFLEHGWNLPDGYKRGQSRSPLNFTLAEWQQARRAGKSAAEIKAALQECWNGAKDGPAFKRQLEERGYYLAREIFYDLREAQILIETWRRHYNTARPHSSLGYKPPAPKTILPAAFIPPYYMEVAA